MIRRELRRAVARSSLLNGLIGYWPMNEASGNAADYVGACTLKPGIAPGVAAGWQYPTAREFLAASTHHLLSADSEIIDTLEAFTVGVWEYPYSYTGVPGSYTSLVCTGSSVGSPGWWFFHTHDGGLVLFVGNGTDATEGLHSLLTPTLDAWNGAMAWHDPDADVIGVQLNGGTPATQAYTNGLGRSINALMVGTSEGVTEDWFDGRIGAIALWNRVLTAQERLEWYASGRGWRYTGPHRLPQQVNVPWAIAGGAPMPVLCYRGKGATSFLNSLVNLANPGYKNLLHPNGNPAWDDVRGWKFDNANSLDLSTDYVPAAGGTLVLRFANDVGAQNCFLSGANDSGSDYMFTPWQGGAMTGVYGNKWVTATPQTSGVIALNADALYCDGSLVAAVEDAIFGTPTKVLRIGSISSSARTCDITHWMFYAEKLTAGQIAAVSTAVAAL